MKKKYAALFVSGALLISNAGLLKAESFEGRESEMNAKCAVIKDTKTQEECSRYKDYLQSKSDNLDKEISDIKSQIASVKGDVEKVSKLIADNNKKIASYEKEISSIQASIDQTQSSISDLKKQIKEKEDSIKERDKQMRARLLEMQAYTGSNYYIDFLMGSTSFTDLLRRTEIVGELNRYENEQIKTLNKEKKKLDQDRKIVEEQKELLVVQQKDVKSSKAKVEALNEVKKDLLSDYHAKEANLATQKREAQMAQANLPKVDLSLAADFDEPEQQPEKPVLHRTVGMKQVTAGIQITVIPVTGIRIMEIPIRIRATVEIPAGTAEITQITVLPAVRHKAPALSPRCKAAGIMKQEPGPILAAADIWEWISLPAQRQGFRL